MRLEPIVGTEIYNDIRLGHTWYEVGVLMTFLKQYYASKTFIEIGIHEGGLSAILIPNFYNYIGIELDCNIIRPEVKRIFRQYVAELWCTGCFDQSVHESLSAMTGKIIYCDGGHKAQELLHFKDCCHPGDILMSHDFWDGEREVFAVPQVAAEVVVSDIASIDADPTFIRLPESIFKHTRIIGWQKNEY